MDTSAREDFRKINRLLRVAEKILDNPRVRQIWKMMVKVLEP